MWICTQSLNVFRTDDLSTELRTSIIHYQNQRLKQLEITSTEEALQLVIVKIGSQYKGYRGSLVPSLKLSDVVKSLFLEVDVR